VSAPEHHAHLYQLFVHVADARGSVISGMFMIGRIAYRREGVTGVHSAGEV